MGMQKQLRRQARAAGHDLKPFSDVTPEKGATVRTFEAECACGFRVRVLVGTEHTAEVPAPIPKCALKVPA